MTKIYIAAAAMVVAAPAVAQTSTTTTNCQPLFGQVSCTSTTQTRQQQEVQLVPYDNSASTDRALRQRELDLRERELRVREAEAGIAPPPPQSTAKRMRRALFGF